MSGVGFHAVATGQRTIAGDETWTVAADDGWRSRHDWVRERYARRYAELLTRACFPSGPAAEHLDDKGHDQIATVYATQFGGVPMFDQDPA